MNNYWAKGFATVGVWIGVGMTGLHDQSGMSTIIAICATFATLIIWGVDETTFVERRGFTRIPPVNGDTLQKPPTVDGICTSQNGGQVSER